MSEVNISTGVAQRAERVVHQLTADALMIIINIILLAGLRIHGSIVSFTTGNGSEYFLHVNASILNYIYKHRETSITLEMWPVHIMTTFIILSHA